MKKEGTIVSIDDNIITVSICQQDACASCNAKTICGVTNGKIKNVECYCSNASEHKIGDKVSIHISSFNSFRALLVLFILPTIVLIGAIFAYKGIGLTDGLAAFYSIATLAAYFGLVFIFQKTIKRRFLLYIE